MGLFKANTTAKKCKGKKEPRKLKTFKGKI